MNFRALMAHGKRFVVEGKRLKANYNKLLPFDSLALQVTRHSMPSLFFNLLFRICSEGNKYFNNDTDKEV